MNSFCILVKLEIIETNFFRNDINDVKEMNEVVNRITRTQLNGTRGFEP